MGDGGLDTAKVLRIINHPVRMRIIELLATRGPMSWKELSAEVGIRTGALYHHLDTLERIVTRDSERRYALTKLGQEIHAELNQNPTRSAKVIERAMKRSTPGGALREVFVPRGLILSLASSKAKAVASLLVVSAAVLVCLSLSDDLLLLYSFSSSTDVLLLGGTFVGSLVVVTVASYASISVAFKQSADVATMLTASALSFLPLSLFGLLVHYAAGDVGLSFLTDRTVLTVSLAFFQAWGAGIVGAGMSVASGLRIEKTLVVSLVMLYATMLIIVFQGGMLT
jgi:DNA-binding transcriptional ArsR family regulator